MNILFLTILIYSQLGLYDQFNKFSNEIYYPIKSENNTYKFYLEIEDGVSMSLWNENHHSFDPVIKKSDGHFYVRNSAYSEDCNSLTLVNDTKQLDSIIVGSGTHRQMILLNKMFPGTPIVVPLNAKVEVTVKNKLMSEAISLHWHGITQKNSFWMDGASRVTQCPIIPGETFTYKFKATELGTHWYHSHSGVQRTEGFYAPLVVTERYSDGSFVEPLLDQSPTIKFDKEFFFMIQDFFQEHSSTLTNYYNNDNMKYGFGYDNLKECFRPTRMDDGAINTALSFKGGRDAIIVNGKGSYKLFKIAKKIKDVDRTISDSAFQFNLEEFEVEPNKAYLFRVVGSNSGLALQIRVGGHKMTIVSADGNKIKPIRDVDSLIVNAGERYDFYIETKDFDNSNNYFIVVKTIETTDFYFNKLDYDNYGLAILKYKNVLKKTAKCLTACQPLTLNSIVVNCPYWSSKTEGFYGCISANEYKSLIVTENDKQLLKNKYFPDEFEEHFLNLHFSGANVERASINGKRFVPPTLPPFFKRNFSQNYLPCSDFQPTGDCTNVVKIARNKTIQFVISNIGAGASINRTHHPIHFHGHQFFLIAMGYSNYDKETKRILSVPNKDIDCQNDAKLCSKPKWSNQTWGLGNVADANYINPPLRDTVTIPKDGYAVLRFRSDNPGLWLLHCHIEIHVAQGMSMIIQSGTNDEIRNLVNFNDISACGKGFSF